MTSYWWTWLHAINGLDDKLLMDLMTCYCNVNYDFDFLWAQMVKKNNFLFKCLFIFLLQYCIQKYCVMNLRLIWRDNYFWGVLDHFWSHCHFFESVGTYWNQTIITKFSLPISVSLFEVRLGLVKLLLKVLPRPKVFL